MGTHAQLGVKRSNGEIIGCYVHYDGYPEHMKPAISEYIDRFTTSGLSLLILTAQGRGGMRAFNYCPNDNDTRKRETEFFDESPFIINEANWNENCSGAAYHYLIDYETGEVETWSAHESLSSSDDEE